MDTNAFTTNLNRSLDYIKGFSTSFVLQALISDGALDLMKEPFRVEDLSRVKAYRPDLFAAAVKFLVVEDIVALGTEPQTYQLTDFGVWIAEQPGWINLLVGGYQNVFSNLTDVLKNGSNAADRNARMVGLGSFQISLHDALPLAWRLIQEVNKHATRFVDIGCGDGYFVREICRRMPDATAIGVEPSQASQNAVGAVEQAGLAGRIEIRHEDGLDFTVPPDTDFVLFAFVLQELLPQIGEARLVEYFQNLRESGFTGAVLAIEVEYDPENQSVLRTPIGRGYYNPYYLLHPLTNQKLMPIQYWKDLFDKAGFRLVAEQVVDPRIDPSGLELGLVFNPA
ncbi:MAG: methyltransferase domain-containing protein [Thiohalocapsa sp.]